MEKHSRKADLHVHSCHSKRPSEWILRKIGCAESYTDPFRLYQIAVQRGMDLVTITDHNTINGSLEIAHLDNTFISEEITTYFPADRCKLHVLAYDITEVHHDEITRLRENVYDLVAYLNQEQIVHVVAHPMYAVNDRLTLEHFEQLLVLFKNFEVNGTRDNYQSHVLRTILLSLTQEKIEHLAEKHHLTPSDADPWRKHLTGGSDDHSSVNIASKYTEVAGATGVADFLAGIAQNRASVGGWEATPKAMAHTFYSIAYQFYKSKFSLGRYVNKEVLLRFAERSLTPVHEADENLMSRLRSFVGYRRPAGLFKAAPHTMQNLLLKEARSLIWADPDMRAMLTQRTPHSQDMWEVWFRFVDNMADNVLKQFADSILKSLSGANLFNIFHTIGSVGSLYTLLAPYFVAYTLFIKDRQFCELCDRRFLKEQTVSGRQAFKIAHFTDTFHDVNGVATTLKMYVKLARKYGQAMTLVTCGPQPQTNGVMNFDPIGAFIMPLYPDLKLFYPPLLKMLDYCYEEQFTHLHSATPGPVGLAALAIARILKLPIYGTYHTALPQYASQLTEDPSVGELTWKYVIWYYNQMDVVYVPSQATGAELAAKGIDPAKIRFYPRGTDIQRFHPAKRNGFFETRVHGRSGEIILLYVGRVSKEKNLHVLTKTFQQLVAQRDKLRLIVVGDGPYLNEMKQALAHLPATFTGFLQGEDLAEAYASSDIFIFPSTTDTFGNVVLEAQASGIPAIVTDQGGPQENVVPDTTGFVVPGDNVEALVEAVLKLNDAPDLLHTMKHAARHYMEGRSLEAAFSRLWESYQSGLESAH
jgi:glycosyltransferase involved in cell wall biosynthesis